MGAAMRVSQMTFVFWQGIISIHQQSFLEALARHPATDSVLLVVEKDISDYRKNMGWQAPEIRGVTVIQSPSSTQVDDIVQKHKDAIHTIGGIRVSPMLSAAFDACIRHKCNIGVMTEPYNHEGWKGMLRTLKYRFLASKYFRHIQFVLAIGKTGVEQYRALGYPDNALFPWAYFITVPIAPPVPNASGKQRIIYAGRLTEAKGIKKFVERLANSGTDYTIDLYGEGTEENAIRELAQKTGASAINIHPFLKYNELLEKYAAYDWVVLPSAAKDGWGAIVSEGLLNGAKALCSNICGASRVITNGRNGMVFDWQQPGSVDHCIKAMLNDTFAGREEIKRWASDSLSGEAGAQYFIDIINNVYNNQPRPGMPWERTTP